MKKTKKVAIRRIKVEKLFGFYDYEIPRNDDKKNIDTILILYGENGSGKTTILKLIFHLLACEPKQGHKTFVAKTKFRSIEIQFTNGCEVRATRKSSSLTGSFEMQLRKGGKTLDKIEFLADSDNRIRSRTLEVEEAIRQNEFLRTVATLNLSLYLLSDDRKIQITSPEPLERYSYRRHMDVDEEALYEDISRRVSGRRRTELDPEQISLRLLEVSIEGAVAWLRHQVMRGSTRGESDVNLIYSDIIEKIASVPPRGRPEKGITREGLSKRISDIEKRNKSFSKFGLATPFNGAKLQQQIEVAFGKRLTLVRRIIMPYLDSLEAKLNALNEIQNRVESLINTINSFLIDKSVYFNIAKGFTIKSRNKEELSPRMLSSGERHLFLLFCNTITALDKQSIFIIDEPEISLNVKWQRTLITSLLSCAKNSPIQYIFATHSMEILSQHMNKVVKLESKSD